MKILCLCLFVSQVFAFPTTVTEQDSFLVRPSSGDIQQDGPDGKEGTEPQLPRRPKIYEMRVDANVTNRFAHAVVTSKVKNFETKAQEAVFSIILPKKAFISKFVMSINDKDYEAYVKEKEQAQQIYNQAVASGLGAGLVASEARDSNRFTVSVNVEPESKVVFRLTYEQLLEREDNKYEMVVNIHPKQPVKDLTVYVNINESLPLRFVSAPPIRSGNEISEVKGDLDPRAAIHHVDTKSAVVKFSPNLERQKELAKTLGTNVDEGLSGQFVVQYDVERSSNGGEVLLDDGYFVHFFAPSDIKPLPKYVLFVLDTSGSMYGGKLDQLKAAMKSILGELKAQDKFHLIDFNNEVKVLNLHDSSATVQYPSDMPGFHRFDSDAETEAIGEKNFTGSYNVNADNVKRANEIVEAMDANGGTNIADALKVALYLVEKEKETSIENAPQPMIFFLTDGDATVGITNSNKILTQVQEQNKYSVPIFSLSFGEGADKNLLQKLSLRNNGFSRHIYDAADASLQLQDFYKHISSPTLSNVTFKYVEEAKDMTKTVFPILFEGSELVVVGRLGGDKEFGTVPKILGHGIHGPIELIPEVRKPVTRLERLWAYLTIQQLLDDAERTDNKTAYEKKALDLALQYSFVTPVSSLVVVKPNATNSSVEPIPAVKDRSIDSGFSSLYQTRSYSPLYTQRFMGAPAPLNAAHGFPAYPVMTRFNSFDSFDSVDDRIFALSYPEPKVLSTTVTPAAILVHTTASPIQELKTRLPWLNGVLNDDVISTPEGNYKLGLNETSTDDVACLSTPRNDPGLCKLLHECPVVHSLLTNVDIFQQYRCDMRGFAAICCPKNDTSN